MDNQENATYIDEMYAFLVQKDNYYAAMELAENLAQVDRKLKDEFWKEVTFSLHSKVNKLPGAKFISKFDDPNIAWFRIEKESWAQYMISTDNEDIGINIISKENIEMKLHEDDIKLVVSAANDVGTYRNIAWPCWRTFSGYRFQTKQEKVKILPELRNAKVEECSNILFNYIEKCVKVCDRINEITGQQIRL